MLVHICCSVDSHYFLERLQRDFPDEKLVGYFYDPNIHPYSEYRLRLLDVQRTCKKLGIELIEGDYDYESWLQTVNGFENEPEKGKRCEICFDNRLESTVHKAIELDENLFTTTLLISPLKSQKQLLQSGNELQSKFKVEFIFKDYRSGGGVEKQNLIAKSEKLYRQNYCGCFLALDKQRESQEKLADELISDIHNRVLPESIEERLNLYERRVKLEESGQDYTIIKDSFLNYRLLKASITIKKRVIPSHFLFYSHSERKIIKGRIDEVLNGVGYLNRDGVKLIELQLINRVLNREYSSVNQLLKNPPTVEEEAVLREYISHNRGFSLSIIVVVDMIPEDKIEIDINSRVYQDIREILIEK